MTTEKATRIRNAQFELRHAEQLQPPPLPKQQARPGMTFIMSPAATIQSLKTQTAAMIRFTAASAIPSPTTLKTLF
ncbi:hypothetical protein [Neisseria subflava]|uniref:hypothetical protein n=1 Tax=Neisseria subflava TaxID=28449 RepID=UPI0020B64B79|nr:hypothetical protein [Neisseria subflava]